MTDNMGLVPMSAELTMFYHDFESSLAFAAQQERERIIKLLEDEELHTHPNNTVANYDKLVWEGIKEQLIKLIKGEQK